MNGAVQFQPFHIRVKTRPGEWDGGDKHSTRIDLTLHVGDEVTGEGFEVDHFGRLFRADDEPEVMAVVSAVFRKGLVVSGVALGVEHPGLLAVAGHALAFETGDVRGKRGRTKCPAAMTDDPGSDHDTAGRTE